MYAVGRPHPLKAVAREFLGESIEAQTALCTSAEVLQELLHAYLPVNRPTTLDAAMSLVVDANVEVWPLEGADIYLARQLAERLPGLAARDLCHLASCQRRRITAIATFDRAVAAGLGAKALR